MNTEDAFDQIKARAEALVKRGGDIRTDTARLVEEVSDRFYRARNGLNSLVKAVAEGAIEGAREAMPEHAGSVLRSVVEGLTDGLARSAQVVRLTLEESATQGTRFAHEDLHKLNENFRTVGELMVDTISEAAASLSTHLRTQAHNLAEHARKVLGDLRPGLESAFLSAQEDPAALGRETVHAGAAAVRQATGVLFTELGHYLETAGQSLKH